MSLKDTRNAGTRQSSMYLMNDTSTQISGTQSSNMFLMADIQNAGTKNSNMLMKDTQNSGTHNLNMSLMKDTVDKDILPNNFRNQAIPSPPPPPHVNNRKI
jgi:hypothetical protein